MKNGLGKWKRNGNSIGNKPTVIHHIVGDRKAYMACCETRFPSHSISWDLGIFVVVGPANCILPAIPLRLKFGSNLCSSELVT